MENILSNCNLGILCSKEEGFPNAILEYFAFKLPVITTTGTPWQEIKDKDAGWWIELSQENLDNALEEALNCGSDELKAKGNRGFDIIKQYTWDKQAIKMKNEYLKILEKKDRK